MKRLLRHPLLTGALLVVLTLGTLAPPPAAAITFGEEEELSAEILRIIFKRMQVVEDPYITGYVNRVGRRILAVMPQQPFRYRFYVINQDMYNAFATPAGHIFLYSGL
ncbi:peptidase M48 Ste24p, partial [bacterium]|nr:peptidase M48 Ste24p [bacterium]